MKHLSLAAKYRPQTFAQVAGQDMVKAVLSRAAAEDRVAAAYLLSGTRGVGKTTIARIFAKALNCRHAPGPEPCNQCDQCRKITQGSHVDVTEIDGASNNSVEDARALRENIGYAPMEGRYKVFIIDEAHMLSRSAFNALLKTLEEPPARVVFIFATTEAHKFPITIVSRCQHFVFRHLGEDALVQHLSQVLNKENVPFEEGAVRLIARRAAGSVRDSMSLLDQTLALGGDNLTSAVTREVLGLAGQELFADLFDALHARDCAAVSQLCASLFRQGVDIGFFVRELAGHLRDLFLLRQGGEIGFHGYNHQPLVLPNTDYKGLYAYRQWPSEEAITAAMEELIEFQQTVLPCTRPGRWYWTPSAASCRIPSRPQPWSCCCSTWPCCRSCCLWSAWTASRHRPRPYRGIPLTTGRKAAPSRPGTWAMPYLSGPRRPAPVNTGPRRKRAPLPAAANPLPSLRPPGNPEVAPGPSGKCPPDRQPVPHE